MSRFFDFSQPEVWWLILGFLGQLIFAGRFIVQWIESEKKKQSVIPIAFWWLSLLGSLLLLAYSIHREDMVFILGQSMGFIVYTRNLQMVLSKQKQEQTEKTGAAS
jgi:lipid-A-disaccharide synthase-like uncharacterized protein